MTQRGVTVGASTLTPLLASCADDDSVPDHFVANVVHAAHNPDPILDARLLRETGGPTTSLLTRSVHYLTATAVLVVVGIAAAIFASSWQATPPPEVRAERPDDFPRLEGEWKMIAWEKDGREVPEADFKPFNERIVFSGDRVVRRQTAPNRTEITADDGVFSTDDSRKPATIDMKTQKGVVRGIYKLDGDVLKLCVTQNGGPRPHSFSTREGDRRSLHTYRKSR